MIWRARRLKEIADSNKPAFASTTGMEWWLAEAPAKSKRSLPAAPVIPMQAFDFAPAAISAATRAEKSNLAACEAESINSLQIEDFLLKKQAPVVAVGTLEPRLTWDPHTGSFVAS
jgi:hypothetical protein